MRFAYQHALWLLLVIPLALWFVRLQTREKTWLVVLAPPSRMERRGLPRQVLAAGTTATVHGCASVTTRSNAGR